jgi:Arylsulfotransferase (ASST)
MKNFDAAKVLFNCTAILLLFICGMVFGAFDLAPRTALMHVRDSLVKVYHEKETLTGTKPEHFLQTARYSGEGVTIDAATDGRDDLILLSGFFDGGNELRLIRRDGSLAARWPLSFSELFADTSHIETPPSTNWNIDTHGALIEPDGSVVFNFEYAGLVKLNRCGEVVWTLPRMTHHSVEPAAGGGYWVPSRRHLSADEPTPFPPFPTPFAEDTLLRVSADGEVLSEISLPGLIYDNGLEALLTASGHSHYSWVRWDREIVHLNKIAELPAEIADDFPLFEAGDLALSIRQSNLVMVVDPDSGKVKWWRIGPWLRQHDPEFKPGGTLVVFNNNAYKTAYLTPEEKSPPTYDQGSNIIEIDPASGAHEVVYGDRAGQEMLTIVRGKVELLPDDNLLVTEFEGGRVFQTDAEGKVVWEYVNRYSAEEVAEITEARAYPNSYFTVESWSCDGPGA